MGIFNRKQVTGWAVGHSRLGFPVVSYRCPACKTETLWEFSGNGTPVVTPDAHCCAARQAYPATPEFQGHLQKHRKFVPPEVDGKPVGRGEMRDMPWFLISRKA